MNVLIAIRSHGGEISSSTAAPLIRVYYPALKDGGSERAAAAIRKPWKRAFPLLRKHHRPTPSHSGKVVQPARATAKMGQLSKSAPAMIIRRTASAELRAPSLASASAR